MKHIDLIKQLIQIPSVSGNEQQIQEFIFSWLKEVGLTPEWQGENVVARIPGKDERKALIFNAHVDTVSAGDVKAWSTDPFAGEVKNGKIFGLGASDEKGGVASMMLLAEHLVKEKPAVDVWLTFVVKEEVDGSGTRSFVKWWSQKKLGLNTAAVLVEPTGLESVEIGHKGNVFIKLTVNGDSGHGSRPSEVNTHSVLTMAKVLLELEKLGQSWTKYKDPVLGIPTIGVGTSIQAGDTSSPNKFADTCVSTIDIRTVPSMHNQVKELLEKCLAKYPVTVEYLYEPCGFGITDRQDSLVKAVKQVLPEVSVEISPGATDQCFFTEAQIPAIVIGPGEKSCMHQPDEWCELDKIAQATKLYTQIVEEWGK